jgi:hypothetical protein
MPAEAEAAARDNIAVTCTQNIKKLALSNDNHRKTELVWI